MSGVGYVLKTIGSAVPRTRKENAGAKRQGKSYRFNGEKRMRGTNQAIRLQGCLRNFSRSKKNVREKRSPLRLNVFGRGKAAPRTTGVQEHENRIQLNLKRGISLEMSRKYVIMVTLVLQKASKIDGNFFTGQTGQKSTGANDISGPSKLEIA